MRWWNKDSSRQWLALPPAMLGLLGPGDPLLDTLLFWDIYAVGYLLLTWFAVRHRSADELRALSLVPDRQGWFQRYTTSSPESLAQGAAATALVVTVVAMPQATDLGAPPAWAFAVCVLAVITSWLTLQVGYMMIYLGLHSRAGGLEFPGDDEPAAVDFAYLAFAVGTSFGTTDVTVTRRAIRRQVINHGILAFVFNTLIVAIAVTITTTYIAS